MYCPSPFQYSCCLVFKPCSWNLILLYRINSISFTNWSQEFYEEECPEPHYIYSIISIERRMRLHVFVGIMSLFMKLIRFVLTNIPDLIWHPHFHFYSIIRYYLHMTNQDRIESTRKTIKIVITINTLGCMLCKCEKCQFDCIHQRVFWSKYCSCFLLLS